MYDGRMKEYRSDVVKIIHDNYTLYILALHNTADYSATCRKSNHNFALDTIYCNIIFLT